MSTATKRGTERAALEYERFGFGIAVHQNGETTISLYGVLANGAEHRLVNVELTELQGIMLLSDLAKFGTDYIREVAQESAIWQSHHS